MKTIYKRELHSYFHTMIGCVFIAFMIAFTGIYFMAYNLNYGYPYFSYVISAVLFVFMIAIPVLTMKSFAEDRKSKADQLLLTAPVSLVKIVMGKYLAMVTILAVPCAVFLIFPLIIAAQGTAYIVVDYLAILLFFLLGCVYIAIGMFVSSLTESQIIAAIGTFGVLMLIYLWNGILDFLPSSAGANMAGILSILTLIILAVWQMTKNWLIGAVLEIGAAAGCICVYVARPEILENALSTVLEKFVLTEVFTDISSNNIFDTTSMILYLSLIAVFVFLTVQMIQKRRWS